MFMRRFAITLIIISTSIYGSVFFLAKQHGTGFFDEILMQLNRLTIGISNKLEVEQSKIILLTILKNDHPPETWRSLIIHNQNNDHNELFYYYKIWLIKSGLSINHIARSYPIFRSKQNNLTIIKMRYGSNKPVIQFPFSKNSKGILTTGLFFPLNETSILADLNKDNKVNAQDVMRAKKIAPRKTN